MSTRLLLAAVVALMVLTARPSHAQIVRPLGGGGIVVQAPYAPRIVLQAPGVIPGRPYLLPRRRALAGLAYGVAPVTALPPAPTAVPRTTAMAPAATASSLQPLPSVGELQTMDDSALLNALVEATRQLDADVGRFDTGRQWQAYLRLPENALPPPTDNRVVLGFASLESALARFDAISANSQFAKIWSLPSFAASRAALGEVVRRFGPRRDASATLAAADPSQEIEELPAPGAAPNSAPASQAPTLAAPANLPAGEQSILVK
jgi:hypothetical protein